MLDFLLMYIRDETLSSYRIAYLPALSINTCSCFKAGKRLRAPAISNAATIATVDVVEDMGIIVESVMEFLDYCSNFAMVMRGFNVCKVYCLVQICAVLWVPYCWLGYDFRHIICSPTLGLTVPG